MATQVFSDEELERLRGFPEISRDELFRFFTLTPADVAFVDPGRGRGPADRLGLGGALCTLAVAGVRAGQGVVGAAGGGGPAGRAAWSRPGTSCGSMGGGRKTRTEHLRLVAQYLGWRLPMTMELKELDEFLLARAMEHDSPTLLFRLACEYSDLGAGDPARAR